MTDIPNEVFEAPTMLKKLGAKQILGNIQAVVNTMCPNDGDSYKAYTIMGTSNGVKSGTGTYGVWYAFQGNMEAINYVSGEKFAAVQCFVPEPLQSILLEALKGNPEIQFAFTVSVKRRDNLKEGYEFLVTPHMKTQKVDPLASIREMIPDYSRQPKAIAAQRADDSEQATETQGELLEPEDAPLEKKKPNEKSKTK